MFIASDGEANGADAGVEVEDIIRGNVALDFGKSYLVDWEVDLEKAIGGIGVFVTHDGIGETREGGVGVMIFVKTT